MKYEDYQKLKEQVKSKGFYTNFKAIEVGLFRLSFFGNAASIFFAFFFVSQILGQTMENTAPWVVSVASIVILIIFEYLKRIIFDKFTDGFVRNKLSVANVEDKILLAVSLLLVGISFYLSLTGAKEWAAKSEELKVEMETTVDTYEDSVKNVYQIKIQDLESKNELYFEKSNSLDTRNEELLEKYNDLTTSTWQERQEKSNLRQEMDKIRDDKEFNLTQITKNEDKIKELKQERDQEIEEYTAEVSSDTSEVVERNKGNATILLFTSTFIEFLIIFGIYFKNYFFHKSVWEYDEKKEKDPKYKQFHHFNSIIDLIYKEETEVGDYLPNKTEILKLMKINGAQMTQKDLDDSLKILTHLGIVKTRGSKKSIQVDMTKARDIVKNYLKID